ncbi:MAG TPA: cupredoxin domain-containing protein [Gaiellaceae bacterium]
MLLAAASVTYAPAPSRAAPAVTRVTVKMYEYRFTLSVRRVRAGTVVFSIVNKGQLAHDFAIERLQKTSALVQPAGHTTLRVTFRKPGSYYYLCTVGAHVQYGMHGNLTVTK